MKTFATTFEMPVAMTAQAVPAAVRPEVEQPEAVDT